MSSGQPTDLIRPVDRSLEPALIRFFMGPLVRGEDVTIGVPLAKEHLEEIIAAQLVRDRAVQDLERDMSRLANRLVPHKVLVELQIDDMTFAAVAYQICWFFHWAPELDRIWDRRVGNIVDQTQRLLDGIAKPRSEGQMIARHLIARHLMRLYRVDTKVEFGVFWGSLDFVGMEPDWVKLPGRTRGSMDKRTVWIHERVHSKPVSVIFAKLLNLSPLTSLLDCDRLYPYFSMAGASEALSMPGLCRLVTNDYLNRGLGRVMVPLVGAFLPFIEDKSSPVAERRYMARFILNLILTHCLFASEEVLATVPDTSWEGARVESLPEPADNPPSRDPDPVPFYALFRALYDLRGPLGAAHLLSDDDLKARVEIFMQAAPVERNGLEAMSQTLRSNLQMTAP